MSAPTTHLMAILISKISVEKGGLLAQLFVWGEVQICT